jgi:multisubunit Na+/H+ antiporter MnhC subunit
MIKASKFVVGFFNLALIGTMMQHLMGNILFENILAQPIGYIERAAYPGIWAGIFFVYPVERLALVILAVVVGVPLVRVLKTTFFNDSKKSAKQGSESRVQP